MKKTVFISTVVFVIAIGTTVFAADTLQGVAIYATGGWTEPTWSPGDATAPGGGDLRLYDDGATNGDEVADDGIWTCVVSGLNSGQELEWKIASAGWDPVNVPADNLRVFVPSNGTVVFKLDVNLKDDGLLPDVKDANEDGIAYSPTMLDRIRTASSVSLTGAFGGQLGGSDWTPTDIAGHVVLNDDGQGADETAGDDIYTGNVTGLNPGTYGFKGVLNLESWDTAKFTNQGFIANGGGNLEFVVGASTDEILFKLDAETQRIGAINQSFNPVPGPPWFAHSDDWGVVFTDTEMLYAQSDGTFKKVFTIPTAGDHEVRIRDQAGAQYPGSNNYPFTTTSDNQDVLVIFDPTEHTDPYYPQSNILLVVDAVAKTPLNEWEFVQPVGDFMEDFGGSNWTTEDINFEAYDDGYAEDGDVAAGDAVYAIRLETSATNSDRSLKAVGYRAGKGDGSWKIQFGGPGDGLTISGDNSLSKFSYTPGLYTFQIDTLTGRVGVGDTLPERPSLDDPTTKVDSWSLY